MDSFELIVLVIILSSNFWQNAGNDIIITTIVEPRFVRYRKGVFTGFIPDLIAELSELANFNYTFRLVNDGRNDIGKRDRQHLRKAAVEELRGYDTDMIATTLSMSKKRKELVDFSIPFDKHWITAIFKRPPVGMSKPFARFEDLLYQSEYVYGTVIRSSVDRFFGATMESPYWEMGGFMDIYDEFMVDNIRQGLAYVRNTDLKYMLLIDSTVADHYVHKYPCDLVTFGVVRSKGYGFAFRKGDTLLKYKIDDALRLLIKNGTVVRLKEKWWIDDQRCDFESRYYYY